VERDNTNTKEVTMTTRFDDMTTEEFDALVDEALAQKDSYKACERLVQEAVSTPEGKALAYRVAYDRHLVGAREGKIDHADRLRNFFLMAGDDESATLFGFHVEPCQVEIPAETLAQLGLTPDQVGSGERITFVYQG
jgi:hypothetical protein